MPDGGTIARARQLVAQLDFDGARQLLGGALAQAHQHPTEAEPWEAEAAAVYAGVLLQLNDPHSAGSWADYAYSATRRLHGERDRRTLHALGVLAVTQHRAGTLDRASRSYQQLVTALSAVDGPESERALAAKADAAMVEHGLGMCANARAMLAQVVAAHKVRNGPAHPVGIRMTARLAGMWRDCGQYERAHELLAQARAQAAALAPDDETHRVIATAAETPMNRDHRCGMELATPQVVLPPSKVGVTTPEVSEWPDDEILDQPPAAAPDYLPPPAPAPSSTPPQLVFAPPTTTLPPPAPAPSPVKERTNLLPLVAIGTVAAAAVALVAVAVVASSEKKEPAGDGPTAAAQPSVAASGPASGLRLTDNGDNVVLTWVYPAGAAAPIIVSAATAGEPMRPMQSLPAGTQTYTLPGLNPQRDYCLTVTVAYSADHTVMAPPVCTKRK